MQVDTSARHWTLTIYNEEEQQKFIDWCRNNEAPYWSYQDEICPETHREHLQAYIGFETQKRFGFLKRQFPTAHVEMARDSNRAYEYSKKEESRKPDGRRGASASPPAKAGGNVWEQARTRASNGASWDELTSEFIQLFCTKPGGLRQLYERYRRYDSLKPLERCVIVYGPPGTGKSTTVRNLIGGRSHFQLANGKWADGYNYEDILWIDDMEPSMIKRATLLQLMETGHFPMEVKGGFTTVHVKEIYITSNWDPRQWFPEKDKEMEAERGDAVLRRAEVYMTSKQGDVSCIELDSNTIVSSSIKAQATIMRYMNQ